MHALIEAIQHLAAGNQILVGGVGTVAFGSLMWLIRSVPLAMFRSARRLCTIELSLTSESHLYHEILRVLSRQRIGALARIYTTDGRGDVVAGYGRSLAFLRGRLVAFQRSLIESNLQLREKLEITIFSRRIALLTDLIKAANQPLDDTIIQVYRSDSNGGYFFAPVKKRKRSLASVFCAGSTVADIRERIEWFHRSEQWYLRRGIPYKLVVLLHGPPGTGKTSLVYALASEFGRKLCTIGSVNSSLARLMVNAPDDAFIVIEDVDMLTVARKDDHVNIFEAADQPAGQGPPQEREEEPSLSGLHILINTLDGVATPHGLIVFLTTNYRDRLDPALLRDGRIDMDIEVGPLDREATAQMFAAFYGDASAGLIASYLSGAGFRPRTGAELQSIFMAEPDPRRAVAALRGRLQEVA